MLIIDDILRFPVSGILWIFREVHEAVKEEQAAEGERITAELMELHRMLDAGKITNALFDAREKELLDRLDEMEER